MVTIYPPNTHLQGHRRFDQSRHLAASEPHSKRSANTRRLRVENIVDAEPSSPRSFQSGASTK